MGKILLTAMGSLGNLNPILSLAIELKKRGQEIGVATHINYKEKVISLGLQHYSIRPDKSLVDNSCKGASKTNISPSIKIWVNSIQDTYIDLISIAKNVDIIITGEGVFAARMVAEAKNIPWVSVVLQPSSFFSVDDKFLLQNIPFISKSNLFRKLILILLHRISIIHTTNLAYSIHQFRKKNNLEPLAGNPFIEDKYSPYSVLGLFSPKFAQQQVDWGENVLVTGFTFHDGSHPNQLLSEKLFQFINSGEQPIVFTLGSIAVMSPGIFFRESICAVKLLRKRAVLIIGNNKLMQNISEEIFCISYLPYSEIFPYACIVVHHGGIGTTAHTLRAGKPSLIVPFGHDQPNNAARLESLGTSRTISRASYSAVRVAEELSMLLENKNYTDKAKLLGSEIRRENGVKVACDEIEKQLILSVQ